MSFEPITDFSADPAVQGFFHPAQRDGGDFLVLTHGAGANCRSPLLIAISEAFAKEGVSVLRCDLPYRQSRPHGPPFPAGAARDRQGIVRALELLKTKNSGRVFAGGHSYGGRQATMLAAEQPQLVQGLLLLSYPLHPPRKPSDLRIKHFPQIAAPAFFVHGSRDPFGSMEEMNCALKLIPASTKLLEATGMAHSLLSKKGLQALAEQIAGEFLRFVSS